MKGEKRGKTCSGLEMKIWGNGRDNRGEIGDQRYENTRRERKIEKDEM